MAQVARAVARTATVALLLAVAAQAAITNQQYDPSNPKYEPGYVVVGFEPGSVPDAASDPPGLQRSRSVGSTGRVLKYKIKEAGRSVQDIVNQLSMRPGVSFAEPNYVYYPSAVPNDDSYATYQAWAYQKIGAEGAWGTFTGAKTVRIGHIDTGVDMTHPDLLPNLAKDAAGNVINFAYCSGCASAQDVDGHGSHTAGILAAAGNNSFAGTGVNWKAEIVSCKFLTSAGGNMDNAAQCLAKFAELGIWISSNSWGGPASAALKLELDKISARGGLFFVAAGNGGSDQIGDNIDGVTTAVYPASYTNDCIVSVTATDGADARPRWANYGAKGVDLAAPGLNIWSTWYGSRYMQASGTSQATPFAAGAAALLANYAASVGRALTGPQLKCVLLATVDKVSSMASITTTGGRLNLGRAMAEVAAGAAGATGCLVVPSAMNCTVEFFAGTGFSSSAYADWKPTWDVKAATCASLKLPSAMNNKAKSVRLTCGCTGPACDDAASIGAGAVPALTLYDGATYSGATATLAAGCTSVPDTSSTCLAQSSDLTKEGMSLLTSAAKLCFGAPASTATATTKLTAQGK